MPGPLAARPETRPRRWNTFFDRARSSQTLTLHSTFTCALPLDLSPRPPILLLLSRAAHCTPQKALRQTVRPRARNVSSYTPFVSVATPSATMAAAGDSPRDLSSDDDVVARRAAPSDDEGGSPANLDDGDDDGLDDDLFGDGDDGDNDAEQPE